MRELLSNNSLFVGQLYKEKSLALRSRDLIFFTTNSELLLNNTPLLEVIYLLSNRRVHSEDLTRKIYAWALVSFNIVILRTRFLPTKSRTRFCLSSYM